MEQVANIVFGLNVFAWAVLSLAATPHEHRFNIVRLCIASLHLVVGCLLLVRRPAAKQGSAKHILSAIPALVLSGLAFGYAPDCTTWNRAATGLFVAGTAFAIAAFCILARNFAVLPAVRGVSQSGPYRIVRHPAYLGETIMVAACMVARPDLVSTGILVATVFAVALRIRSEERLLTSTSDTIGDVYQTYCNKVTKRLVPFVW